MTLDRQHQVQENHQQNSQQFPSSNAENPSTLPAENGFRPPKITEIRKSPHPSPGVQLAGRCAQDPNRPPSRSQQATPRIRAAIFQSAGLHQLANGREPLQNRGSFRARPPTGAARATNDAFCETESCDRSWRLTSRLQSPVGSRLWRLATSHPLSQNQVAFQRSYWNHRLD